MTTTYRCPFCKGECSDELGVMVELDGTLLLICETCYERGEEAAEAPDAE
jgi:ribosome-binding protein aMBF1 (putative translation factor)